MNNILRALLGRFLRLSFTLFILIKFFMFIGGRSIRHRLLLITLSDFILNILRLNWGRLLQLFNGFLHICLHLLFCIIFNRKFIRVSYDIDLLMLINYSLLFMLYLWVLQLFILIVLVKLFLNFIFELLLKTLIII